MFDWKLIFFRHSHSGKPTAIFVDLDRCCDIEDLVSNVWINTIAPSALYNCNFTNAQIDWRQLGCTRVLVMKHIYS